jgi:hypothetical protein
MGRGAQQSSWLAISTGWPLGTDFFQLPSVVIGSVDHSLGSPSPTGTREVHGLIREAEVDHSLGSPSPTGTREVHGLIREAEVTI